jgi:hypothetical protein
VSDNDRGPAPLAPNDGRDIARKIMQRQPRHRTDTVTGTARLRPQYPKAGFRQLSCDPIEILGGTAARRQHHDQRPPSPREDLKAHVIIRYDFLERFSPRRHHD